MLKVAEGKREEQIKDYREATRFPKMTEIVPYISLKLLLTRLVESIPSTPPTAPTPGDDDS